MKYFGANSPDAATPDSFDYGDVVPTSSHPFVQGQYRPQLTELEKSELAEAIEAWKMETAHLSSPTDMMASSHFVKIVKAGSRATDFIMADLGRDESFLFLALEEITGQNPVYEAINGNLPAIVGAWQQWYQFRMHG